MPLLKSYLNRDLSPRDRNVLTDIIAQGIKTDAILVLDPNAVVAKTNGRVQKPVIESLLDRIILPSMLNAIPKPIRASDLYLEESSLNRSFQLTTGWRRIDRLLGGQGWTSGEVSEICGSSGSGKTQICLNTMITMLVQDRTSRAIWIDTLDGGFSAQRASNVVRSHLSRQSIPPKSGLPVEDRTMQDQILETLSRIQIYSCRDIYDVISVTESIRENLADTSLRNVTRLVVVDSMSTVLTGLLRGTDGAGHATMIHSARELGRLAVDFDLVVLVTTISVQISLPEEQPPSILATSNSKPGLGSSWRYATDLQLYLTRLNPLHMQQMVGLPDGSGLFGDDSDEDYSKAPIEGVNRMSSMRVAEILKSKRLKIGEWSIFDLTP